MPSSQRQTRSCDSSRQTCRQPLQPVLLQARRLRSGWSSSSRLLVSLQACAAVLSSHWQDQRPRLVQAAAGALLRALLKQLLSWPS